MSVPGLGLISSDGSPDPEALGTLSPCLPLTLAEATCPDGGQNLVGSKQELFFPSAEICLERAA